MRAHTWYISFAFGSFNSYLNTVHCKKCKAWEREKKKGKREKERERETVFIGCGHGEPEKRQNE